jgi:hypothetical protein
MAVDLSKAPTILVIHGVQTEDSAALNQHLLIKALVKSRLGSRAFQFETDLFRYEDINDQAQAEYLRKHLFLGLLNNIPIKGKVLDLVGDVVTARSGTSTAAKIRAEFQKKILQIYETQSPCYVVAHSLGTIYAFDVINELMQAPEYFVRNDRTHWPVQGLLTIGSPLGLAMFRRERAQVTALGVGDNFFPLLNYWDRQDPVVSGAAFGTTLDGYSIVENYLTDSPLQGWDIQDKPLDTGNVWLMAHVAYWQNPVVGDGLLDMMA